MRHSMTTRMTAPYGVLNAMRQDKIGWDHDPCTATFMMNRVARVTAFKKGGQ